jgi:hypothetical protein
MSDESKVVSAVGAAVGSSQAVGVPGATFGPTGRYIDGDDELVTGASVGPVGGFRIARLEPASHGSPGERTAIAGERSHMLSGRALR